jgi:hypothetical protein
MNPLPTFCRCEVLASLRHLYLGSFSLEPGAIWSFSKAAGLLWEVTGAQRALNLKRRCIGALGSRTHVHLSVLCGNLKKA